MFWNETPPRPLKSEADDTIDREIEGLIAADVQDLGRKPDILTFLARELGEAIDRAQGKPPIPPKHKN